MPASIDTSLVIHALYPRQQTESASQALEELLAHEELFAAPALFLEFPSFLRREVNRRNTTWERANEMFDYFINMPIEPVALPPGMIARAYEIASRLNQSDIFDAAGYATAEALDAEFWTSDRRFASAARQAGLDRCRFVD